jgi:hypothetical protein
MSSRRHRYTDAKEVHIDRILVAGLRTGKIAVVDWIDGIRMLRM